MYLSVLGRKAMRQMQEQETRELEDKRIYVARKTG
jgi:hypothetical protein